MALMDDLGELLREELGHVYPLQQPVAVVGKDRRLSISSGTPRHAAPSPHQCCNYLSVWVDFRQYPFPAGRHPMLQRARLYGHRPCYNMDGFRLLNVRRQIIER
jgi:hypothetical protein